MNSSRVKTTHLSFPTCFEHDLCFLVYRPDSNRTSGHFDRLCVELELENGLPDMVLDTKQLPLVRDAVSLAKQIDRCTHSQSRKSQQKKEKEKLAREMDLPTDSDEDSEEEMQPQRGRQADQLVQLKQKLSKVLGKMGSPIGKTLHELAREQKQRSDT